MINAGIQRSNTHASQTESHMSHSIYTSLFQPLPLLPLPLSSLIAIITKNKNQKHNHHATTAAPIPKRSATPAQILAISTLTTAPSPSNGTIAGPVRVGPDGLLPVAMPVPVGSAPVPVEFPDTIPHALRSFGTRPSTGTQRAYARYSMANYDVRYQFFVLVLVLNCLFSFSIFYLGLEP